MMKAMMMLLLIWFIIVNHVALTLLAVANTEQQSILLLVLLIAPPWVFHSTTELLVLLKVIALNILKLKCANLAFPDTTLITCSYVPHVMLHTVPHAKLTINAQPVFLTIILHLLQIMLCQLSLQTFKITLHYALYVMTIVNVKTAITCVLHVFLDIMFIIVTAMDHVPLVIILPMVLHTVIPVQH